MKIVCIVASAMDPGSPADDGRVGGVLSSPDQLQAVLHAERKARLVRSQQAWTVGDPDARRGRLLA